MNNLLNRIKKLELLKPSGRPGRFRTVFSGGEYDPATGKTKPDEYIYDKPWGCADRKVITEEEMKRIKEEDPGMLILNIVTTTIGRRDDGTVGRL